MEVRIEIRYACVDERPAVLLDGTPVGIYGPFSRCAGRPFSEWYEDLPAYCRSEANSEYTVAFRGGSIHGEILRRVFQQDGWCRGFSVLPSVVVQSDRAAWARELLTAAGTSLPPTDVALLGESSVLSSETVPEPGNRAFVFHGLPVRLVPSGSVPNRGMLVALEQDDRYFSAMTRRDGLTALFTPGRGRILCRRAEGNCFLFQCGSGLMGKAVRGWLEDMILPEWLTAVSRRLSGVTAWNGMNQELACAKRDLLTGSTPWIRLDIPDRVELSSTPRFRVVSLPEHLECNVRISDPAVLTLDGSGYIHPRREGSVTVSVGTAGYPGDVHRRVTVYRYRRVSSISLTQPRKDIMVGDQLRVQSVLKPANANNISQARWEASPIGVLRMTTPGVFQAEKPGRCTVTLRVEGVSASVNVDVYTQPTGMRLNRQSVTVKLGDDKQRLMVTVFPPFARGTVEYAVDRGGIVDIDPVTGQLITRGEGTTSIHVRLLDGQGRPVESCRCDVTVLPSVDLVTPDMVSVVLVASLVGFVLLALTPFRLLFGIAAAVSSIILAVRHKSGGLMWAFAALAAVLAVIMLVLQFG